MKCLVLGANGFIGSHLTDLLKQKTGYAASFARKEYLYNPDVKSYVGDFSNKEALEAALIGHDCVIHSVSSSTPAIAAADPRFDIEANLLPTIFLVQAMARKNVKKLVYISSGGTVYGNPLHLPVSEQTELKPVSVYGATKVAVENYLSILCTQLKIDLTIIRPSNPFGPRQYNKGSQGLIATLLDKAIKKQPIILFDNGNAIRDYIYIDDLIEAIYKSVIQGVTGIYNISYDAGYSVSNIKKCIEDITLHRFECNFLPKRDFDIDEIILDSTLARKKLNWKPTTTIEAGIQKQFNWMDNL